MNKNLFRFSLFVFYASLTLFDHVESSSAYVQKTQQGERRYKKSTGKIIILPTYVDDKQINHLVANMKIGSNEHLQPLAFDIGYENTWIMSAECEYCKFSYSDLFNKSNSTSFVSLYEPLDTIFSLAGTSLYTKLKGNFAFDEFSIDGLTIRHQVFVYLNFTATSLESSYGGRLGLTPNGLKTSKFSNLIENMYMQEKVDERVFTVWLNKTADNGEISLGGVNQNRFQGPITYITLNGDLPKLWQVKLDSVSVTVNGKTTTASCPSGCNLILSSSTDKIMGPKADIVALNLALGATPLGARYNFNCTTLKSLPNLVFTIAGKTFELDYSLYYSLLNGKCFSQIVQAYSVDWTVGAPFLRKFYTIFDLKNQRLGFATPTA